jgi:hypothetical protein
MILLSMVYTNTFETKEACIKEARLLSEKDKTNDYICVRVEESNGLFDSNVRSR